MIAIFVAGRAQKEGPQGSLGDSITFIGHRSGREVARRVCRRRGVA
jgi:hypothetical protein